PRARGPPPPRPRGPPGPGGGGPPADPPARQVTPTAVASVNPAPVRALPARPNTPAARAKFLPLTGTHPCKLEDKNRLVLPERVREYLGDSGTLFLTPAPDACLGRNSPRG